MGNWKIKKPSQFKFEKPGDVIEGHITGCRDTEFNKAYDMTTTDGKTQYFFGSTSLDRQLEDSVGSVCRITYLGEVKTKGGRKMKDFEVAIWDDAEDQTF